VLLLVEMVSAALPPSLVMLARLNAAVAPVGRPDALSVTGCAVLPVVSAELMVEDPDVAPCTAVTELGDADNVKSFVTGALTIKVTVIPVVNDDAPVPLTVTG
jgi:hypothetical protein